MKKLFLICAVSFIVLCLVSCGVASSIPLSITETKVMLAENNFKVIGQAYGEASATYICGIGGLSKKALKNNAINEMSKNANLTGAQTLTNITTNMSIKMITPLYMNITYTATANIIEFTK